MLMRTTLVDPKTMGYNFHGKVTGKCAYTSPSYRLMIPARCRAYSQDLASSQSGRFEKNSHGVRVLRYPDGRERTIRYPLPSMNTGPSIAGMPMSPSSVLHATLVAGTPIDPQQARAESPAQSGVTPLSGNTPPGPKEASTFAANEASSEIPTTAEAFLRWAQSGERDRVRKELLTRAKSSYQVAEQNVFPSNRPLFALMRCLEGGQTAELFTLRTRREHGRMQDELNALLKTPVVRGGSGEGGGAEPPRMTFLDVRDGVLAFQRADDAQRYAELMRAEDQFGDVEMVSVGSDELFALTEGAQALVVLFKCVVSESLCKLLACL